MAVLKFIPCLAALTLVLQGAWCSTIISAEACLTKYGSTSVKSLGTTTYSITLRQTESCIATVTPTTTIQPAPKTVTASSVVFTTKTSTFPNTQISTLTTTQTVQSTTTVTNTITSMTGVTVDVSVTGTVSTVTVPTSAGFVPASQNGLNKQKRQESRARPNLLAGHRPNLEKRASSSIYPTTVSCGILVHIIATNSKTATASKTATVTGMPSTVTMTAYTTSTVVSSYLPAGASTTVTATTTVATTATTAVTSTTTNTATVTFTVQQPAATFYAACSPDNVISELSGGRPILGAYVDDGSQTQTVADSAYDCCVQCFTSPNCGGGYFLTDGSQQCIMANPPQQCDPNSVQIEDYDIIYYPGDGPRSVFDGNCGQTEET